MRSTEKYAHTMFVITVNLSKFQFLVSAQRHDLSYTRLYTLTEKQTDYGPWKNKYRRTRR